ncbi:hypothetical protein C5N92_03275, partial [Glaesserella australis]
KDGTVTSDAKGDNFATAEDVADAINSASKAAKTEVVQGDNIVVSSETGTDGQTIYTVATAKDLNVNSVNLGNVVLNTNGLVFGNNGPSITFSGINAGNKVITNVANGSISSTSTDAVNGSQLYAVTQTAVAAKTEVVQGDNIVVNSTTGANGQTIYTVSTAKDLVVDSVKSGDTTLNNDGLSINGGPQITKDGITGVADGDISPDSTDAVNGSQLYDVQQAAKAAKTEVLAGNNIVVNSNVGSNGQTIYTVETAKDLTVDSITAGNTVLNNNGLAINGGPSVTKTGIDAGNVKITGVATGTADTDAVNVKQLTDSITAAKTTVSSNDNSITVVSSGNNHDLSVNTDGTSIRNGKNGLEVVKGEISTNDNGQAVVTSGDKSSLATTGDVVNAVNNVSWTVAVGEVEGSNGNASSYSAKDNKVKAGDSVSVNAGNNIVISGSGKNINVAVSDKPTFNSIQSNSVNIVDGPSINSDGINMNNKRITNVAPGRDAGDAVNVEQLNNAMANVNNKVHSVDKNLRSGVAGAVAIGSLVQAYNPSDSLLAVGGGTYRGASALALGYSKVSDNGKIILKVTGSVNNSGHYMGGASVGYKF